MVVSSKLKEHQIKILYFWTIGERSPTIIVRKTGVSLYTVKYNLKKLKKSGNLDRKSGSGGKWNIKGGDAIALGQYLTRIILILKS